MKRLVCVGEGHGEVKALPRLCHDIRRYLGATEWAVDPEIVRLPRSDFVAPSFGSRRNTMCNPVALGRGIQLAQRRPAPANAVLIVCDADDDCAVAWARSVQSLQPYGVEVAGVMAVREYEAWLLSNIDERALRDAGIVDPETRRNAKGALARVIPGYAPTTHQLDLTLRVDIDRVRARSKSFDKLVRTVAALFDITAPDRRPISTPPPVHRRRR